MTHRARIANLSAPAPARTPLCAVLPINTMLYGNADCTFWGALIVAGADGLDGTALFDLTLARMTENTTTFAATYDPAAA